MKSLNTPIHQYVADLGWRGIEQIIRIFLGLLLALWIAHYLGPEQYGHLSYAISFIALFSAFTSLGLEGIVIRELVKQRHDANQILGSSVILIAIGSLTGLILVGILITALPLAQSDRFLIGILSLNFLLQWIKIVDYQYQSESLTKFPCLANIISLILSTSLKICLILFRAPLYLFAVALVIETAIAKLVLLGIYRAHQGSFRTWQCNRTMLKFLFLESWPLFLSGIAVSLYVKIDQIMLKELCSFDLVGQYAAAAKLSEFSYFIPIVICGAFYPSILKAKESSRAEYTRKTKFLLSSMFWISITVSLSASLGSDWFFNTFLSAYSSSSGVLKIHIWSCIFVYWGVASNKWYVAEGLLKLSFYKTALGMIVNILLNLLLIPHYHIYGAALATLVSYSIPGLWFDLLLPKTRGLFFLKFQSILHNPLKAAFEFTYIPPKKTNEK